MKYIIYKLIRARASPDVSGVKVWAACDPFFVRDPMTKGDILLQNGLKLGIKIVIWGYHQQHN